jgi:GWxTD domain-containing protein
VAGLTTVAGPADSTLLLFGLSLPAHALRFQREETGFRASYVVGLRASRGGRLVASVDRQETVRVRGFAETARTDESVLFQTRMTLAPGEYILTVRVRDGVSARGFERTDTVRVPAYGAPGPEDVAGDGVRRITPPVLVHRATPRANRSAMPDLVLNPRNTIAYGDPTPLVYLESYAAGPVRLSLLDAEGEPVWNRDVQPAAAAADSPTVRSAVVSLPGDSLPMGRFSLVARLGADTAGPVPVMVALTDQWLASNFDEVAAILGYIAAEDELAALRDASPEERRRLWDAFWEKRDPVPATPGNEYRDEFFHRIRVATLEFGEPGRPGWRTDRGEVYIVLGPPTRLMELRYDNAYATGRPQGEQWVYQRVPGGGRLDLVFVDRNGFGNYRLTQDSEMDFRAAARRIKNLDRP